LDPLLATKLYKPTLHHPIVPRPGLVQRLNESLNGKMSLLSAPAGFGKTTLLCEWINESNLRVAWLSLDENDNDLIQFFSYLVGALQSLDKSIGIGVKQLLEVNPTQPAEVILTELINDMSYAAQNAVRRFDLVGESDLKQNSILVLDDYHLIENNAIHSAIAFFVERVPESLHVVISGRADPPIPLARLRVRRQLVEIRQSDLRLNTKEIQDFLVIVMGMHLTSTDIQTLDKSTEGWVAGLQMAALSMQGRDDISSYIADFTGTNRFILDYLVEEVLSRQPAEVQEFLVKSAILDRMNGSLCEAVTGIPASSQILPCLERQNLFIVPLDTERVWYRFHRLFSDLLRKRLLQFHSRDVLSLYKKASNWFAENNFIPEAIDYAISAEEYDQAVELIAGIIEATMMRSQLATLLRWMEKIPVRCITQHPIVCVHYAWALFLDGQSWDKVCYWLDNSDWGDSVVSGIASALYALAAIYQGRISEAAQMSRQLLRNGNEQGAFLRTLASWNLGVSLIAQGKEDEGEDLLEQAIRISLDSGNILVAVMVLCNLADQHRKHGRLYQAARLYNQSLDLAVDFEGVHLPVAGQAWIGLGYLEGEWNNLDLAENHIKKGISLIEGWGKVAAIDGHLNLSRIHMMRADYEAAYSAQLKARALAELFDVTEIDDLFVDLQQARLWLAEGNYSAVNQWVDERGLRTSKNGTEALSAGHYFHARLWKYEIVILARLLIVEGNWAAAQRWLALAYQETQKSKSIGLLIEVLILQAIALNHSGNHDKAQSALEDALTLAEPGGYIRIFLNEGEPAKVLLKQINHRVPRREYVNLLLDEFKQPRIAHRTESTVGPVLIAKNKASERILVDPLSERELQILRYLVTELSTPEIADELVIAVSTVRSHVKSIYSKLGVHNRYQAVDSARNSHLI